MSTMTTEEKKALLGQYLPYQKDLDFIDSYCSAVNAATGSDVDPNSNVRNKNISTLESEIHKKDNIFANRLRMFQTIKEMYGEELAYEYLRQLRDHEIYRHDETGVVGKPYCAAISLMPFLVNGLTTLGGQSEAPTNLESYCGGYINLVFAVSALILGACATPEFLVAFDHFARKDLGEEYYLHADEVVFNSPSRKRTIDQYICDKFQQVIYSLNQPAGSRTYQSPFINFSYFDQGYFQALFKGYYFPDGDQPKWESLKWLQKRFMKWFNAERSKKILTFPVETFSILNNGDCFPDQDSADWIAQMYSEGHSFFTYTSKHADALSSCCYAGDTKVIVKDANGVYLLPIAEVKTKTFAHNGYRVFNNGKWSAARFIELPNRPMFEITLANGATMKVTDNHRNNCLGGMKYTKDLTLNDYIMMNSTPSDTYPEVDEGLTYEQGFAIGAFLGDGSLGSEMTLADGQKCIYEVNYSLSEPKRWIIDIIRKADLQFGGTGNVREDQCYNNVVPVRISSKRLVAAIMRWTGWQRGTLAYNKRLSMDCLVQSIDFRNGILDGWFATDGNTNSLKTGISLRGYTTSKELVDDMQALCTSLGYITSISCDNRTDKPVFRGEAFNKNYPVYCLLRYAQNKHAKLPKDRCVFRDNSYWFKITSIEPIEYDGNVYCFEMKDPSDDKFTLANGIHNFNCRLRNAIDLEENVFSYSLGAGSIQTGSKCVITMNLNRLVQNAVRDDRDISEAVREQTAKIHKYLFAFDKILMDMTAHHMIPIYDDPAMIDPSRLYLTTGIAGLNEAAEFMGLEPSDNDAYREFVQMILKPIYEQNKADRSPTHRLNTEIVPGEGLGPKLRNWDARDGYVVPDRPAYNSYIFRPDDPTIDPMQKFRMHGEQYTQWLDGGSANHVNLDEHLSKEQYAFLLKYAAKHGTGLFTFNVPNTVCNDCGYISKHYLQKCPKCGSENLDYASRVIGYLTLISRWSMQRQEEAKRRYYAKPELVKKE